MRNRSSLFLLIVVVASVIGASYVMHLIIIERSSRLTASDKYWLRLWLDLLHEDAEMQDLASRAHAAIGSAQDAADQYAKQSRRWRGHTRLFYADNCPAGLTLEQAHFICGVVRAGIGSGADETVKKTRFTWKDALVGKFPPRHKKPGSCLNPHFLDRYPREPLMDETFGLPLPQEVIVNRAALERLANNHDLLELIDRCWQIGYDVGCKLGDDW